MTKLRRVTNLRPGDRVDLTSCPYMNDHPSAEFEWAVVGKVVWETPECIVVSYDDIDDVGYPIDTILKVRE